MNLRNYISGLARVVSTLRIDALKESSALLIGLYSIMFGLFVTESVQRTMAQVFPGGVGHFKSDGIIVACWRIVSLVVCAFSICIFFVHSSVTVIKMKTEGSLLHIYFDVFFVLYLALAPWVSLHISRLVCSIAVPEIKVWVDVLYIGLYLLGLVCMRLFHVVFKNGLAGGNSI